MMKLQMKTVEYHYSPVMEERLYTLLGGIALVIAVVWFAAKGMAEARGSILLGMAAIGVGGYGVCLHWLRRMPHKRKIMLNGIAFRLYTRSRWLYLALLIVGNVAGFVCAILIISLVVWMKDGEAYHPTEAATDGVVILFFAVHGIIKDYLGISQYFDSPEYMELITSSGNKENQ